MNIVYMGTPEFAVPALQSIYNAGHNIVLAVTQPDKPRDRGKKLQPTPVKFTAENLGIPVMQPEKLKGNIEFLKAVSHLKPDLIVVVAYGRILPAELLEIPKYGCINIHGSLLPKYRGAAPIQRAVLSGDEETGVTLMYMSQGMDEGDMIAARSTPIDRKTAGELHDELAAMGAAILVETLPAIEAGTVKRQKQDDSLATYAPMIFKKDGLVDFSRSAVEIERQIRAMNPWPGANTYYKSEQIKLLSAEICDFPGEGVPGRITRADSEGIFIETAKGILQVTRIQMPGKRAMEVSEYLKGNKIEIGTVLG